MGEPTTPRMARGLYGNFPTTSPLSGFGIVAQKKFWRQELGTGFRVAENNVDKWMEPDPQGLYGAKYPYNHVHQTESGHIIEMDDTPGFERLHRYHRTVTFEEIGSLGQRVTKVVNEDYHIILNNDYWRVVGNRYESIQGKLDIFSSRGYFHKTEGTIEFDAAGAFSVNTPTDTFSVNANDIILDAGAGALIMKAKSFSRQVQTSEHTDSVAGNSTLKVSGEYKCKAGSMKLTGRGKVGISSPMGVDIAAGDKVSITGGGTMGKGVEIVGVLGTPAIGLYAPSSKVHMSSVQLGLDGAKITGGPALGALATCEITVGPKSIKLRAGTNEITIDAVSGISVSSLIGPLSMSSLAKAELSAVGALELSSTLSATLKSTVSATVEGSAMTTVKGGVLMLN